MEDYSNAVAPIELFIYSGEYWAVYYSPEQYVYYITTSDTANTHSQWGDPRIYGKYVEVEPSYESSSTTSTVSMSLFNTPLTSPMSEYFIPLPSPSSTSNSTSIIRVSNYSDSPKRIMSGKRLSTSNLLCYSSVNSHNSNAASISNPKLLESLDSNDIVNNPMTTLEEGGRIEGGLGSSDMEDSHQLFDPPIENLLDLDVSTFLHTCSDSSTYSSSDIMSASNIPPIPSIVPIVPISNNINPYIEELEHVNIHEEIPLTKNACIGKGDSPGEGVETERRKSFLFIETNWEITPILPILPIVPNADPKALIDYIEMDEPIYLSNSSDNNNTTESIILSELYDDQQLQEHYVYTEDSIDQSELSEIDSIGMTGSTTYVNTCITREDDLLHVREEKVLPMVVNTTFPHAIDTVESKTISPIDHTSIIELAQSYSSLDENEVETDLTVVDFTTLNSEEVLLSDPATTTAYTDDYHAIGYDAVEYETLESVSVGIIETTNTIYTTDSDSVTYSNGAYMSEVNEGEPMQEYMYEYNSHGFDGSYDGESNVVIESQEPPSVEVYEPSNVVEITDTIEPAHVIGKPVEEHVKSHSKRRFDDSYIDSTLSVPVLQMQSSYETNNIPSTHKINTSVNSGSNGSQNRRSMWTSVIEVPSIIPSNTSTFSNGTPVSMATVSYQSSFNYYTGEPDTTTSENIHTTADNTCSTPDYSTHIDTYTDTSVTQSSLDTSEVLAEGIIKVSPENDSSKHLAIWAKFFSNALKISGNDDTMLNDDPVLTTTTTTTTTAPNLNDMNNEWPEALNDSDYWTLMNSLLHNTNNNNTQEIKSVQMQCQGLLYAILKQDLDSAHALLSLGLNPSLAIDVYNRTCLHHACKIGNISMVGLLIDANINIETIDIYGYTALHISCLYNHINITKLLCESAVNIDSCDHDLNTSLHLSCRLGHIECCKILIQYDSSLELKNSRRLNAIGEAKSASASFTDSGDNSKFIELIEFLRAEYLHRSKSDTNLTKSDTNLTKSDANLTKSDVNVQSSDMRVSSKWGPPIILNEQQLGNSVSNIDVRKGLHRLIINKNISDEPATTSHYAISTTSRRSSVSSRKKSSIDSGSSDDDSIDNAGSGGTGLLAQVVWGIASSAINMSKSLFSKSSSKSRRGSKSDNIQGMSSTKNENEDAPPTDTELYEKGLGFQLITPPAIVSSELHEAELHYKQGLTPRRTIPPSEVAVAVQMYKAAERSKSPRNMSESPQNLLDEDIISKSVPQPLALNSRLPSPLPSPNAYSIGGALPKGTTWRYVDVLKKQNDDLC